MNTPVIRPAGAVVDIGTNTMNLLARDADGNITREFRFPRLGEGVDESNVLSRPAMERCWTVADEYRKVLDGLGIANPVVLATSASRDGRNRDEFFEGIERHIGVRPLLIDGRTEAELSFLGATLGAEVTNEPVLVVDIGGGSTEFAVGITRPDAACSTDIGSVRITETHLHSDPVLPEELASALSVISTHLDDVTREFPEVLAAQRLIGVAGTVTTCAAVEIGLMEYDFDSLHGFFVSKAAAEDVFRTLATETIAQRLENPGMFSGRESIIVGGLCILVSILRKYGFEGCTVSEMGLLDGAMARYVDSDESSPDV